VGLRATTPGRIIDGCTIIQRPTAWLLLLHGPAMPGHAISGVEEEGVRRLSQSVQLWILGLVLDNSTCGGTGRRCRREGLRATMLGHRTAPGHNRCRVSGCHHPQAECLTRHGVVVMVVVGPVAISAGVWPHPLQRSMCVVLSGLLSGLSCFGWCRMWLMCVNQLGRLVEDDQQQPEVPMPITLEVCSAANKQLCCKRAAGIRQRGC
jgi:hypothetical protein